MKTKLNYTEGTKIGDCVYLKEIKIITKQKTEISKRNRNRRICLFKCKCGKEFEADISLIKSMNTTSCGCANRNKLKKMHLENKTHGQTNHPIYMVWAGMIKRCEDVKDISYVNYGGRNIVVCDTWHNINNFIEDMYPSYIKGLQLDRIKNDGNYSKDNCRWVTRKVNANNRRNNREIEYKGVKKNIGEWSVYLGININTLIYRLNHWSIDKSFTYINKKDEKRLVSKI